MSDQTKHKEVDHDRKNIREAPTGIRVFEIPPVDVQVDMFGLGGGDAGAKLLLNPRRHGAQGPVDRLGSGVEPRRSHPRLSAFLSYARQRKGVQYLLKQNPDSFLKSVLLG